MTPSTDAPSIDPALESLTSALVDANDRLLGLLALITADAPASLETDVLLAAIVERAAPILQLDSVTLHGGVDHAWGAPLPEAAGRWETTLDVPDLPTTTVVFTRDTHRFDTGDTKLLGAVARFLVNAITTARMHANALDQALVAREHATAARITSAALPDADTPPHVAGVDLFASLVPARTTGGDLYAWREIGGSLWFALGDVSGKGLPAAVQMSTITSAVDAAFQQHACDGPDIVVGAVDRWVHDRLSSSGMFATLAVGRWSPATATLVIANSGHSPIVFRRNGTSRRIDASAPPIGVIEGLLPAPTTIEIRADDLLVLATDGFTEQVNAVGEMYGEDRFDERIASAPGDACAVGHLLLDEVADHAAGHEQSDDRTLMVLHFS